MSTQVMVGKVEMGCGDFVGRGGITPGVISGGPDGGVVVEPTDCGDGGEDVSVEEEGPRRDGWVVG